MPGLERGSPVSQVNRASAITAFRGKPYVAQPFLDIIGAGPKHLVDDLGPSTRRLLFTENKEIPLSKMERPDDAVSPAFVLKLERLQQGGTKGGKLPVLHELTESSLGTQLV